MILRNLIPVLLFCLPALLMAEGPPRNELAGHYSPYLALHADDPVHWRRWRPELLEEARAEGRLLFLSSGYFACHWCHVMQRESFRNREIAALLNRFTIPVKLDRELNPALDRQLLAFVRATRGHAGWPLNVFVTPEGHPLLGLVYAPAEDFSLLAVNLEQAWKENPRELERLARAAAGRSHEVPPSPPEEGGDPVKAFDRQTRALADTFSGGFGEQSRFPDVPRLRALMDLQRDAPREWRAEFLRLTLDQMARLGLRDHLAGGFFRYTTDPEWRSPHFEKMLYDNAQLLGLYAEAAEMFNEPRWRRVAEDTLAFLQGHMRAPDGAYIASLSAVDAKGMEGGYYRWTDAELRRVLNEREYRVAALWYGLADASAGGEVLPTETGDMAWLSEVTGQSGEELQAILERVRSKLLAARARRVLPRDEKRLAAWNGLLLENLARLAGYTGQPRHRQAAGELRDAIRERFWRGERLYRLSVGKEYAVSATLEDYARVAAGLWAWSRLAGGDEDRELARRLVHEAWRRFRGPGGWRLSEDMLPGDRWPVVEDDALPSPVAVLLRVSAGLAREYGDEELAQRVRAELAAVRRLVAANAFDHASYVRLLMAAEGRGVQPSR